MSHRLLRQRLDLPELVGPGPQQATGPSRVVHGARLDLPGLRAGELDLRSVLARHVRHASLQIPHLLAALDDLLLLLHAPLGEQALHLASQVELAAQAAVLLRDGPGARLALRAHLRVQLQLGDHPPILLEDSLDARVVSVLHGRLHRSFEVLEPCLPLARQRCPLRDQPPLAVGSLLVQPAPQLLALFALRVQPRLHLFVIFLELAHSLELSLVLPHRGLRGGHLGVAVLDDLSLSRGGRLRVRRQALLERYILLDGLLLHSLDTGDGILELGAEVRGGGVVLGAVPGHLVPERLVLQDPASYGRGEFGTGQREGQKNCQNGDPGDARADARSWDHEEGSTSLTAPRIVFGCHSAHTCCAGSCRRDGCGCQSGDR